MSGIMLNIAGGTFGGVPVIGSVLGGGFFAGQIDVSGTIYNLVVGPVASAVSNKKWKTTNTTTAGTTSVIDGPTNSSNMNNASHPAAEFCEAVTTGGFTDWYMPAKNELEVCYYNLKPSAGNNVTNSGTNANAVPARASNYTSGNPTQTSATDFQTGGAEAFIVNYYWSSTENTANSAWFQDFNSGGQYAFANYKTVSYSVRAIRRIPV